MAPSDDPVPVDVSVLIPVLNEGEHLEATVAAMREQRFPGTLEFIFADGRSTDDTRDQLERLGREDRRIRVIDNPLQGTASGLNACLREARGEFVARMDGHTVYPPGYLIAGVQRLREGGADWVAGPQVPVGEGPVSRAVSAALGTRLGQGASRKWGSDGDGAGEEYELDTGVFAGVWRRDTVLAHGGWDEGWPRNQDSEMAARFHRAGQRIVCLPVMAARYRPRESLSGLWRQYRGYGAYRAKTAGRHPASLRRSALLPPALVLDAVASVVAPRRVRAIARTGLGAYALALLATSAKAPGGVGPRETALMPAALVTMHFANGVGFLDGCRRWGVPWRALARVAGRRDAANAGGPAREPVAAPTLNGTAGQATG